MVIQERREAEQMDDWASKSFWLGATPYQENPSLEEDIRADVAIVGAGFAGLSTAYYLRQADPSLRVVVLESDVAGYGASGRNGGFAMTLMGLTLSLTARRFGKEKTRQAHDFGVRAVRHIGELVEKQGVECEYEKNGLLTVATNPAQVDRLQGEIRLAHELGIEGVRWLEAGELREEVRSPLYLGAREEDECALVNPAKLARGVKNLAEGAGAEIYEHTPVEAAHLKPRIRLETPHGSVAAQKVVFATNAFTQRFPRLHSKAFPIFTYIVLTEPLSKQQLSSIGWGNRQGIEDARNLIHYYRLTSENRLLMGGEDALYYYGGKVGMDEHSPTFQDLERTISETFPGLAGIGISHRWGGPVSVPLDFFPAMGYLGGDRRVIYNLGCVGHGVALANMAGQILRDLVREQETELTDLFFVNRRTIPLPPEPLRFALAQGIREGMKLQDGWERRKQAKPQEAAPR
jgi:glycine/D-amino acid oxidase-like deaminating enzyme